MPNRKMVVLAISSLLLMHGVVFWSVRHEIARGRPDFSAFYTAGKIVLDGNASRLYDYELQTRTQQRELPHRGAAPVAPLPYIHPPFEALIDAPLALLPYPAAFLTWYAVMFLLLISVPLLLIREERLRALRPYLPWTILVAGGFLPAFACLLQGQDAIVVLFAFTLCYLCMRREKYLLAGWALALATIKPHLVLPLLLVLLVSTRWRVIAGFAQACLVLLLASVGLAGWRGLLSYPRFLAAFDRLPADVAGVHPDKMANIRGLLHLLFNERISDSTIKIAAFALGLLLLVFLLLAWKTKSQEPVAALDLRFALLIPISLLTPYHINIHDLALLLLPVFLTANYLKERDLAPARRWALAACTVLVLVTPFTARPQLMFLAMFAFAVAVSVEIRMLKEPIRRAKSRAAV
ncbi:MAG: glycosyltransferase family 87 protein [Terriglobales bacterium]